MKNNVRLNDHGSAVNFDHIVAVERTDDWQVARLVSGGTVVLKDIYPVAHDLFKVSKDVWVNPVHVSVVDVGYNKSAAFKDVMEGRDTGDTNDYMQVRVETVLGPVFTYWSDIYGVDEVEYLVRLLEGYDG